MRGPIRTLMAIEPGLDRLAVEAMLPEERDVKLVGIAEAGHEWESMSGRAADVLVVVCRPGSATMLELVEDAVRDQPDRAVVVVTGTSPNGYMRKVFEAGAEDVVIADEIGEPSVDLLFAVEKVLVRRLGANARDPDRDEGELICVLGPKGGSGKTLTTANLSAALADAGHKVAAIDLDLQFGDLGLTLGLLPERTSYDLASAGGSLDDAKVAAYMTAHSSGAQVLLAPVRPEQASHVTVDFLREVYEHLRKSYDFVLIDTPPGFSPEVIATVDSSSHVCMVGMLDALSLKNTKLGLDTLDRMGYDGDHVRVVLNRADSNVGISVADTGAILGRAPDVLIPSHRDVTRSVNAGQAVVLAARRSEAARAFRSLADIFVGLRHPEAQVNGRRRGGFLRRERV